MTDSPVVRVLQGSLRGCVGTDIKGEKFYKFLGIPYAKPPIGELRFRDPVPADSWSGTRDATKEGEICYSRCDVTFDIIGSEDCLFLNVFTKSLPHEDAKPKPVMVWIHGGAFVMGSSRTVLYGPEFLITEDVVLVTINYRLGMLGFLRLEDPSLNVPGNAGLKDQNLALKWVKNNIESFNGDPNNVTIFGESAGGASVHYHVLSPLSSDLFHKAIIQSGCAFNEWALCHSDTISMLKTAGIEVGTEKEALEVLNNMPVDKLHQIQEKFQASKSMGDVPAFGPVIEKNSKKPAFLPRHPFEIISSGEYNKVPLIFGYTNNEGILVDMVNKLRPGYFNTKDLKLEKFIPWFTEIDRTSDTAKGLAKKLKNLYFQGRDVNEGLRLLVTDSVFLTGIMASVKNHLQTNPFPIYLYRMTVESGLNVLKRKYGAEKIPGVAHGDDIGYLFKTGLTPPITPGSLEDISLTRFVKLWTNFAKYNDPTPEKNGLEIKWKPVMKNQLNFLDIGEELKMDTNPETERLNLWREIFHQSPLTNKYL